MKEKVIGFIALCTALGSVILPFVGVLAYGNHTIERVAKEEQQRWAQFAEEHDCRKSMERYAYPTNQYTWVCNNGDSYVRRAE